jgi:hypothetical protein
MRVMEVLRQLAVYGFQKYFLAYDSFNFSVGAALTSNLCIALFRRARWHFPQVVDPVYEFLNARKYCWYLLPAHSIEGLAAC